MFAALLPFALRIASLDSLLYGLLLSWKPELGVAGLACYFQEDDFAFRNVSVAVPLLLVRVPPIGLPPLDV